MFAQYVTLVLVEGWHLVSTITLLPAEPLNGMLFCFTALPLTVRFYLR